MTLGLSAYNTVATYWPSPSQNGFGGYTFGAPQTVNVRWEERIELFVDRSGNEQRSYAIVFLTFQPEEGGYLLKGSSVNTDPTSVQGAWVIKRVDNIPDLRGLNNEIRAYL